MASNNDYERRIEMVGKLHQALLAELELLPDAVRNEVCAKLMGNLASYMELQDFRWQAKQGQAWRHYCDACGKFKRVHRRK